VALSAGIKYYTTVRALTGAGSVLESVSDGFLVDVTPPVPVIKSTGGVALNLTDRATTSTIYQKEVDSFTAAWVVNDPESGVSDVWFRLGTYPGRSCRIQDEGGETMSFHYNSSKHRKTFTMEIYISDFRKQFLNFPSIIYSSDYSCLVFFNIEWWKMCLYP